jgi:hypothetical protein
VHGALLGGQVGSGALQDILDSYTSPLKLGSVTVLEEANLVPVDSDAIFGYYLYVLDRPAIVVMGRVITQVVTNLIGLQACGIDGTNIVHIRLGEHLKADHLADTAQAVDSYGNRLGERN